MKHLPPRPGAHEWRGWTLGQLREFVTEHQNVGDEALLLADTDNGTAVLYGIGFFSMTTRRAGP